MENSKNSSTDGYLLRLSKENWSEQVFALGKYYAGIQRNWVRGTPILLAKKVEKKGDCIIGYGVVENIENLWEMLPEEENYARENGWKQALKFRGLVQFKTPLLIKNSLLKDDKRRGAFLHGAKLTESQIDGLLEQAEAAQEVA